MCTYIYRGFSSKKLFLFVNGKKIPFFIISQLVINLLHLLPSCFHTLRLFYLAINRWRSRKLYQKAHSHFINTLVARYLALVCFERKKNRASFYMAKNCSIPARHPATKKKQKTIKDYNDKQIVIQKKYKS